MKFPKIHEGKSRAPDPDLIFDDFTMSRHNWQYLCDSIKEAKAVQLGGFPFVPQPPQAS